VSPAPPRFALRVPGRERGRLPITPGSSVTEGTIPAPAPSQSSGSAPMSRSC
jgi:hypothetical protein